ncbi:MAG: hypothetical protein QM674_13825 [Burkholderiaceae bacterium]
MQAHRIPDSPRTFASRLDPFVLTLFAVIAVLAAGWWAWQGREVDLPEVRDARLQCASYAPYRLPGETPYDPSMKVSEARLREDLKIVSAMTGCVRTYSIAQGLDAVPRIAKELGMKVLVGAWLGRDRAENERELSRAIELANTYPDTVRALIVGNEVLLRRELPESELAANLRRASEATRVPVTYADVWEFWTEHPGLVDAVSFLTIHILPYWEDEPVGISAAIAHVHDTVERMKSMAKGKEILIGETGWPSGGRQRREAVPGRVEQARFVREFALMAENEGWRYNVIEAFDQPWKRRLEGAMGGYWGLFDSDGAQKFPWNGPVAEVADWVPGLVAAAVGGLLFAAFGRKRRHGPFGTTVLLLTGIATGAVMLAQARYMLQWNRDVLEWGASGLYALIAFATILLGAERLAGRRNDVLPAVAVVLATRLGRSLAPGQRLAERADAAEPARTDLLLVVLRFAMLFGAAFMMTLMIFDARYRGFPTMLYVLPAALLLINVIVGERAPARRLEESMLAAIVAIGVVWMTVTERPENLQAMVFGVVMLVMAGCATNFRFGLGIASDPERERSARRPA